MSIRNNSIKDKVVNGNNLIGLFNSGHRKLVPISSDGKIPMNLTEEDIFRLKKEVHLQESGNGSWFTFIDDHPDFWTQEKLADPYYRRKFDNVAKVTGFHGNNEYEFVLDIDSDTVFELLKSPKILENHNAKEFVNRYSHFVPKNVGYSSLIEFLSYITYVTMTRKKHGYHIHWVEHSQFKQIESTSCIKGKEFEIFTKKYLVMLPPSIHRDDPKFEYCSIGNEKVQVLDGLYELIGSIFRLSFLILSGKLSATIVIPIEIARKYGLDRPSDVIVEETDSGILIRKVNLEKI
jgi:hypothetical protein